MKQGAGLALVMLVACSCSSPPPVAVSKTPAVSTPSTPPSAQAAPTPASPAASPEPPSPAPGPDLPVRVADFTCRLPVLLTSQFDDGVTMAGGFVTFPGATYQADPRGTIVGRPTGDFATNATPALYGLPQVGSPFYDRALTRWLPVGPGQTSPDGASYAYSLAGATGSDPTSIHVVDVAHATDRVLSISPPTAGAAVGWEVADFDGGGVLIVGQQFEQYPASVWRLDVGTGAFRELAGTSGILLVRGGYAWAGFVDPRDPSPPRSPRSGELFDSIAAVNLATGAKTVWIYRPGQSVTLDGLDAAGHPVVSIASAPNFDTSHGTVFMLATPGGSGTVVSNTGVWLTSLQADPGRLWFGNDRGIYVWTASEGLRKVFAITQPPNTLGTSISPAGFCL